MTKKTELAVKTKTKLQTNQAQSTSLQLHVTLIYSQPSIWRRIVVPTEISLGSLHAILQIAFDWTNSHLHQFRLSDQSANYSNPVFQLDEMGAPTSDEFGISVGQLLASPGQKLIYTYDFGDGWDHEIVLEKILTAEQAVRVPQCLDGDKAGPPDDCGGVGGYADLLDILQHPKHPEHQEMVSWLVGIKSEFFDPDVFEMHYANHWLAKAFKTLPRLRKQESWWYRSQPRVIGWRKAKWKVS